MGPSTRLLALGLLMTVPSCLTDGGEFEGDVPSFEEYRQLHAIPGKPGRFVVADDLIGNEDQLRSQYEAEFFGGETSERAIIHAPEGTDARNPIDEKLDLTYCVSTEFGGSHDRLVDMMQTATSEWELYGDVNFVHRAEYDDECDRDKISAWDVSFTMERFDIPYANGFAFFPDYPNSDRILGITEVGLQQSDPQLLRTVRHELGHILGFRHAHMYTCPEQSPARSITPTDEASIMWTHAVCPNSLGSSPGVLSRYDALGAAYTYNLPTLSLDLKVLGSQYTLGTDFNSDAAADVRFVHTDPGVLDHTLVGGKGGLEGLVGGIGGLLDSSRPFPGRFSDSFGVSADIFFHDHENTLDSIAHTVGPDFEEKLEQLDLDGYHVPLAGDFDGNGYTDVFWYGPGSASDEVWYFGAKDHFVNKQMSLNRYTLPVVGDFNDDGKDDIFWYDPEGTTSWTWHGVSQAGFEASSVSNSSVGLERVGVPYFPIPGDFNDDGHDDIFWYRPGGDSDQIWFGSFQPYDTRVPESVDGQYRPIVGDYDGNGATDIFWYGQGTAYDSVWYFDDNGHYEVKPTEVNGDYAPFAGDFDADGDTDILWYQAHEIDSPVWYANKQSFESDSLFVPGGRYPIGYGPAH